jgi:hypothetical protein
MPLQFSCSRTSFPTAARKWKQKRYGPVHPLGMQAREPCRRTSHTCTGRSIAKKPLSYDN